jgi:glycosyltransferase involved in cell wall biosynthesis
MPDGAWRLVYDAESSDGTSNIARALGASFVSVPWRGFAQARSDACVMVTTPWTFMLDADERLTPELRDELLALDPPADVDGYLVARKNVFCGRWIRGAGWWPDRLVRLFRSGRARIEARHAESPASLHETWIVAGRCEQLKSPIEHQAYATSADYLRKFAHYTALEAHGSRDRTGAIAVIAAWAVVPIRAAWLLFARGGVLDGWRGLYVSVGSACYPAVVKWKARSG